MIRSYTINGAVAAFIDDETGSIEPGKSADLVVLSDNIFEIPAERIGFDWIGGGGTKVLMTVFRGKTMYRAPEMT